MSAHTITVTRQLPAPADQLFVRLCDLDAHRNLAAPHIDVVRLRGPRGARTGGEVELRGPLGIRIRATTAVRAARFPRELTGTAATGRGTTATMRWELEPAGSRTVATARLVVQPRGTLHRLLLLAGGRPWLRRRLATAIERLAAAAPARVAAGEREVAAA